MLNHLYLNRIALISKQNNVIIQLQTPLILLILIILNLTIFKLLIILNKINTNSLIQTKKIFTYK